MYFLVQLPSCTSTTTLQSSSEAGINKYFEGLSDSENEVTSDSDADSD